MYLFCLPTYNISPVSHHFCFTSSSSSQFYAGHTIPWNKTLLFVWLLFEVPGKTFRKATKSKGKEDWRETCFSQTKPPSSALTTAHHLGTAPPSNGSKKTTYKLNYNIVSQYLFPPQKHMSMIFIMEGTISNVNSVYNGRLSGICEEDIFDPQKMYNVFLEVSSRTEERTMKREWTSTSKLIIPPPCFLSLPISFLGLASQTPQPQGLHLPPKTEPASQTLPFLTWGATGFWKPCLSFPHFHSQTYFLLLFLQFQAGFIGLTWGGEGSLPQPLCPNQEEIPLHASAQRGAHRKQPRPLLPRKLEDCGWQAKTEPMRREGLGKTEFSRNNVRDRLKKKSSQQVHKLHRVSHKKDHEGNTLKNKQKCGYRRIGLWVTIS